MLCILRLNAEVLSLILGYKGDYGKKEEGRICKRYYQYGR